MVKILTILGARPQFVKAGAVSRVIIGKYGSVASEVLVHTGQHFDHNMSAVFFGELGIAEPDYNLGVSGGTHGEMTGRMLSALDPIIRKEQPDFVLVYGDTNSTLAGALSAVKFHVPVAHVEAGLRSFNMKMPEEINRVLTDKVSTLLFCPTQGAVNNLSREGILQGVHQVGDVMFDVSLYFRDRALGNNEILQKLGLKEKGFVLATFHRAENTDDFSRLEEIVTGLSVIARDMPVVVPLHPRTRAAIRQGGLVKSLGKIIVIPPVSFFEMTVLENASCVIVTDSGGMQKEALFFSVPCVTLRDETEWPETVSLGWNRLVGASAAKMVEAVRELSSFVPSQSDVFPYGKGDAADRVVKEILGF